MTHNQRCKVRVLGEEFFIRKPDLVAKELLGKVLVRRLKSGTLKGMIVETEAYYGPEDPASRARRGKLPHNRLMWEGPGTIFIYMVHGSWLLNIVTEPKGVPSAVLIRAVKPLQGIRVMLKNRGVSDIREIANGPGKLSKAFVITKELNGLKVYDPKSPLLITDEGFSGFKIGRSYRIGVKEDLNTPLRFYIVEEMEYVSKPPAKRPSKPGQN